MRKYRTCNEPFKHLLSKRRSHYRDDETNKNHLVPTLWPFCRLLPRVWVGAGGIWVRPGNEDPDPQRHHAGGAFPDEEQRLQDVQEEAEESGEVHPREQPGHLLQWVYGESIRRKTQRKCMNLMIRCGYYIQIFHRGTHGNVWRGVSIVITILNRSQSNTNFHL